MPTPLYGLPLYGDDDEAALDALLNGQSTALETALSTHFVDRDDMSVPTVGALPTSGNWDGRILLVSSERILYVWVQTAAAWTPIPAWKPVTGGAVTVTAGAAGYAAGTPAPQLQLQGGRYYLSGRFGNGISAAFGAAGMYAFGSIPSASAPSVPARFPASTNAPISVSIDVAADGTLSLVTHQAFTGTAVYMLDGISWANKAL